MFRLTPIVRNLLVLNVAMFLLQNLWPDVSRLLIFYDYRSSNFYPFQIFTHMFLHNDFSHLLFNMLPIVIFGPHLENHLGDKKFLLLYVVSGVGAGLLYSGVRYYEISHALNWSQDIINNMSAAEVHEFVQRYFSDGYAEYKFQEYPQILFALEQNPQGYYDRGVEFLYKLTKEVKSGGMLGASGAVFGVLMGMGLYFPNARIMLLIPPIPMKMKHLVIGYGALELFSGLHRVPGDNVAHFAHIGGMLFAFILVYFWRRTGR